MSSGAGAVCACGAEDPIAQKAATKRPRSIRRAIPAILTRTAGAKARRYGAAGLQTRRELSSRLPSEFGHCPVDLTAGAIHPSEWRVRRQ